ncbi:hypothetical protein AUR04nite_31420 [Glutamicibacter uratoxydans]|uniref:Uncharacterized protein n=1 Tax=Glutamicibacter uratoxydans TaxID=43667 RepID=A0A4Y4DW06_GLUUR|nr:hypothetical protein [Glutamicibacter uratoxydans]GED07610.1 hypothetical protein AUR04nite_31420 [Glutamicibacter uratoxydans]
MNNELNHQNQEAKTAATKKYLRSAIMLILGIAAAYVVTTFLL